MATPGMPSQMAFVPAQLGFLAIFNPSLGTTDETMDDQIVYYASISTQSQKQSQRRRYRSRGKPTDGISQEERNERLRQIGLAQGMVEFSRGFANGEPVNTIETEKTRVVLHEVEPGWWILAVGRHASESVSTQVDTNSFLLLHSLSISAKSPFLRGSGRPLPARWMSRQKTSSIRHGS